MKYQVSFRVKTWYLHHCYGYIINHALRRKTLFQWNGLVFHWCLYNKYIYKITKIVHALWLAERSVCIRVCKHGCGVKLFGFLHADHASTNLKNFSSSKLDKFTLFIHSFVDWNLENRYKEGVSIFHRLSWHFKREISAVCTAPFCNFATGKNFSFNQCHTKSFAFFPGKVIL